MKNLATENGSKRQRGQNGGERQTDRHCRQGSESTLHSCTCLKGGKHQRQQLKLDAKASDSIDNVETLAKIHSPVPVPFHRYPRTPRSRDDQPW